MNLYAQTSREHFLGHSTCVCLYMSIFPYPLWSRSISLCWCMHAPAYIHIHTDTTLQSGHAHLPSYQQCMRILYPNHLEISSFLISDSPVGELEVIQMPVTEGMERNNIVEVYNAIKCRFLHTHHGWTFKTKYWVESEKMRSVAHYNLCKLELYAINNTCFIYKLKDTNQHLKGSPMGSKSNETEEKV